MNQVTGVDSRSIDVRSTAAAFFGALAAASLWVGMTAVLHLIFHFQPALVGMAAGWTARRAAGRGRRVDRAAAVVVASVVGLACGLAAIAAIDGPTDPLPFTLLIAAAGVAVGEMLLVTASEGARVDRRESDHGR